jgi:hypothetical protein
MSDTTKEIERLQHEYDQLEREGVERFGTKAGQKIEKQIREEIAKRLAVEGGDRDAFKAKKGKVFRALHGAKSRRLAEIKAGVSDGCIGAEAATAEIVALGWADGFAKAAVAKALMPFNGAVETLAIPELPPEPVHTEVMDPVGAEQPVAQAVTYAEPGRNPEPEQRGRRRGR